MHTSYSALETYKICPRKYQYEVIDKIRAPKRIEAVFGTLIHGALKYMFERNPLYPTEDEVIDYFSKKFSEKSESIVWPANQEKEKAEKAYYDEGIKLIKNFYAKNKPWNFNPVELETRFMLELAGKDGETHTVAGIIDRIDKDPASDRYEIIDYKTGRKMPSEEQFLSNLQLGLYHLAVLKRWPHLSPSQITTSLYFLKHNEKISAPASKERAEAVEKDILATIEDIERHKAKGDFPPTPGPLCGFCAFRKICPMWSHEYAKDELTAPDDEAAKDAIREFFEIKENEEKGEKRLKELRGVILSYMDAKKLGRVFGSDGYLTKTVQERASYDLEKLESDLREAGLWDKILEPDEKRLLTLLPTLPEALQEKIKGAEKIKSFVTLKSTKRKEAE